MENANLKTREDKNEALESTRARNEVRPLVDIYEGKNELLLVADLPGVDPARLDLRIEPPELRIEATVGGDEGFAYVRSFNIDERIAADKVSADLNAGVLTVHLPKVDELKPRKIAVQAG